MGPNQRLLALFGEREFGCGYPITSWFGQLCHCFPPSGAPPAPERPRNSWPPRLRQLFQFLQRGVVDVIFFSRGFGHARLIHFLFDASEYRLVGLLLWLVFIHTCTMSQVQRDYRSIGNRTGSFRIVSRYSFSIRKFPRTRVSISLLVKVLKALAGVFTIGSPLRLKEVLSTAGTPVACPKRSINPE